MARVHVTAEAHVSCGVTVVRVYPAGYRGPAPDDHIERIVAAGKGVRLTKRGQFVGKPEVEHVP